MVDGSPTGQRGIGVTLEGLNDQERLIAAFLSLKFSWRDDQLTVLDPQEAVEVSKQLCALLQGRDLPGETRKILLEISEVSIDGAESLENQLLGKRTS